MLRNDRAMGVTGLKEKWSNGGHCEDCQNNGITARKDSAVRKDRAIMGSL